MRNQATQQHPKLKPSTRPLFSCGFIRYCTQTVLSPTTPNTPSLPPPPPPPPPAVPYLLPSHPRPKSKPSSSPSSTSLSTTQWRFSLPQSPVLHRPSTTHFDLHFQPLQASTSSNLPQPPLPQLFHVVEIELSSGSKADRLYALHLLERSLVAKPATEGGGDRTCPPAVMKAVVGFLKDPAEAKSATKVLLALCLSEGNRHVAVEEGAVAAVVETVPGMEVSTAEWALAALDLLCTVPKGAEELRSHALAVPMLVQIMGRVAGRGKECAISVLAEIYGGGNEGVAAVMTEDMRRLLCRESAA